MTAETRQNASDEAFDHTEALEELEEKLGYRFEDRTVLERALTHRSFANEVEQNAGDNQRLEFLGDAVLGLIVANELFHRDREVQEGALSTRQAQMVCEPTLADLARELELGRFLRLGRGESTSGGRDKSSLLADAYEALLAAIYLDGGLDAAQEVVIGHLGEALREVHETSAPTDYKSRLQTVVQREKSVQPHYRIIDESGPPHDKVFVAEVCVDGRPLGAGRGRSKKEAEQHAAEEALETLGADHGSD
ncbi:ribonuclease III [Persicimonas caeni]|uniref:Ribonuclease 3 n=1 Tax=Persicimonas caeni TaxID=2292766 RepID=A0A4Y6Q0Q1_PERCE|nr:ribonuclease III [Persicimonas caeni]QDG54156.1 ribonuclease III [Persicimonas caeni]QED35377.1 ribonuclease III [Persicimonas caeni]